MADWGQGASNNDIGWGQGVVNNDISWGSVCADSYSGDTDILGETNSFLLDTYTGAAAAYSLRQLSSTTTNVVRVRRSSDNAEQDFTANQITDETLIAFCGAGNGFVTTWYDQSGLNRNAIQTTATNQPQIVSSGSFILENGKPSLNFANSYLKTLQILPSISQPITIFSIYNGNHRFIYDGFSSLDRIALSATFPDLFPRISAGVYLNSPTNPVSIFGLTTAIYNTLNSYIYRDGIELVNGNVGINVFQGLTIGANSEGGDTLTGKILEIILYPSDKSSNRASIEDNINNFYSIY